MTDEIQDRVDKRALSPCAVTVYERLRRFAAGKGAESAPVPNRAQLDVLANLQAEKPGVVVGRCWALVEALGGGPSSESVKKVYQRRNVQMALRALESHCVVAPYASGLKRSIAYMVFSEPVAAETIERIWSASGPGLTRRLAREASDLAPIEPTEAAPAEPIIVETDGDLCSVPLDELEPPPLSKLALAVLDRVRRLVHSVKAKLAPWLTLQQQAALGETALMGKCWFHLRAIAKAISYCAQNYSPRAVQAALRELEAHGWICPYSVGPLASTAYVVFQSPASRSVILGLWTAASDSFARRMERSRYVDRANCDQPIALSTGYAGANERQHTIGAAVFYENDAVANGDGGGEPPSTAVLGDAPNQPESQCGDSQTTDAPSAALLGKDGPVQLAEILQRLRGLSQVDDVCLALCALLDKDLRRIKCSVVPVLRWIERARATKPLAHHLEHCLRHVRAITLKKSPPSNPAGYLWASLSRAYDVPPLRLATVEAKSEETSEAGDPPKATASPRRRRSTPEAAVTSKADEAVAAALPAELSAIVDRASQNGPTFHWLHLCVRAEVSERQVTAVFSSFAWNYGVKGIWAQKLRDAAADLGYELELGADSEAAMVCAA